MTLITSAVTNADVSDPAHVFGMHGDGTRGFSHWKCLTRRMGLSANWEAVEWACLPPGGSCGAHLHTRTEELYFILAGTGRIAWDGDSHEVRAGDLILTPLGAQHGLTNTGPDPLPWLVVEVSAAAQSAAFAGRSVANEPTTTGEPVSLHIVNLREVGHFDATTVLDGPIRDVRMMRLGPGESLDLDAVDSEYTIFTVAGRGTVHDGAATNALMAGVAMTLPLGNRVRAQAADDAELELFVASLAVAEEAVT